MSETMPDLGDTIQSIDAMLSILSSAGANPERVYSGDSTFSRVIRFTAARGVPCYITWWRNVAYLSIGGSDVTHITFTGVRIDTTWPACKRGLRFATPDDSANTFVVVATHLLPWQETQEPHQ